MKLLFNRANWHKTVLIALLSLIFVRLGLWQLDRLEERRASNELLRQQLNQEAIDLTEEEDSADLTSFSDRQVTVTGAFDFGYQIIVKSQVNEIGPGVRLAAPFVLENSNRAIMVDRGWLSSAEFNPAQLAQYDDPATTITGYLRPSDNLAPKATPSPLFSAEQFRLHLPTLDQQLPYDLLPMILMQGPASAEISARPYRSPQEIDLSEGPHMAYALQWFAFALLCSIGYIFYLRGQHHSSQQADDHG